MTQISLSGPITPLSTGVRTNYTSQCYLYISSPKAQENICTFFFSLYAFTISVVKTTQ